MKYLVLDQDVLFGGKSFLVCGDLCQLPPVRAKPVFIFNENKTMERFRCMDLWRKFRLAEVDQVMHHDDEMFVKMLKKIRVVEICQSVEDVIKLLFVDKNDPCYPGNILHIFAENAPVKRHNDNHLKHIPGQLITIYLQKMKFLKLLKSQI